jgi:hypothetical protein
MMNASLFSAEHMRSPGKFYKGAEVTVNPVVVKDGKGVRI